MKTCGEFTIAEPYKCKVLTRKERRAKERSERKAAYKINKKKSKS